MKTWNLILAGALCVSLNGCAYLNYMNHKTPSELAMYGGMSHDEAEQTSLSYIAKVEEEYESREKASVLAASQGWDYIKNPLPNNLSSLNAVVDLAMREFNTAWLLDENNYQAYWGFGVCSSIRGWLEDAEKHFSKAMELNPQNAALILDVAFNCTNLGSKNSDSQLFDQAIVLYNKAMELAPDDSYVKQQAYAKWAFTLYYRGDYASAWEKITLAEKYGWECPPNDFLADLSKKMPRPK